MKQELSRVKEPKRFDFILASIIIVMILTSLLSIYSSLKLVPASYGGYGLILKQLMWAVVGLVAIIVIMYFGNDALYDFIKIVYWILLVMLVVLFLDMMFWKITGRHFPGGLIEDINGAVSWYQIPGIGTFQPSEFMKIVLIVKTALIIDEHNKDKTDDTYESDLNLFYKIIKTCLVPVLLILLQPDTGICIIIFISIAIMTGSQ